MYLDYVNERFNQFRETKPTQGYYVALRDEFGAYYCTDPHGKFDTNTKLNIEMRNTASDIYNKYLRVTTYGDYYPEGFHVFESIRDAKLYIGSIDKIPNFEYVILEVNLFIAHTGGCIVLLDKQYNTTAPYSVIVCGAISLYRMQK